MSSTYKRTLIQGLNQYLNPLFTAPNGVWSWFSSPNAVCYNGNTYFGYVNNSGDVIVAKFTSSTSTLSTFTLHAALEVDDHDYPAILIRPDGKIQCFYCKHGADNNRFYRISSNIEDISSFSSEQTLTSNTAGVNGATYSNVFYLSSESKYYWFWRGGDYHPAYATSTDGQTWTNAATLYDTGDGNRPYVKYCSNNTDTIHFTCTSGHPDDVTTSIYYFKYTNGNFYKADGTLIKSIAQLPLNTIDLEKIYDASANSNRTSWTFDIAYDSSYYPVIVYTNYVSTTDHRYRYIRWNGSSWIDNEIIAAGSYLYAAQPHYSAGICLDHANPNIIYFSKQNGSVYELFKGITNNNGSSFNINRIVTGSNNTIIRPISVLNASSNFSILFPMGSYTSYINYSMTINHN